jgi:cellulose synthase/poly-beta-1,6-N-acetylglucosamine synthase-like glycosyltransferase
MFEQPIGWLHASLPQIIENTKIPKIHAEKHVWAGDLAHVRLTLQEQRWEEKTTVSPSNTHCTIIMPVHNEQHSLPSSLGALLASDIPSSADIQFIFVINASTDSSKEILKKRLGQIHPLASCQLPPSTHDTLRSNTVFKMRYNNLKFLIVETPTAGKANALTLGNEIALSNNHSIAINIDANNWVEPNTIATMYKEAIIQGLEDETGNIATIDGISHAEIKTHLQSSFEKFYHWIKKQAHTTQEAQPYSWQIMGWLFAWNTKWVQSIGGIPSVAIEDRALAVEAHLRGKHIYHTDAPIWGYTAATFQDRHKEYQRFILGALQILRKYQGNIIAKENIAHSFPIGLPIIERIRFFFPNEFRMKHTIRLPLYMARWLRFELVLQTAKKQLAKNPHQQTWDPISSTK